MVPYCRFIGTVVVEPRVDKALQYLAAARATADVCTKIWAKTRAPNPKNKKRIPHPNLPEAVALEVREAPAMVVALGAGSQLKERPPSKNVRELLRIVYIACAQSGQQEQRTRHKLLATKGVMGTSGRATEDSLQGLAQVTPGYSLQDRANDVYTHMANLRNQETAALIATVIRGTSDQEGVLVRLGDVRKPEICVPSWLTAHDCLPAITTAQFMLHLPYSTIDVTGNSAGVMAACLLAALEKATTQEFMICEGHSIPTRTMIDTITGVCGAVSPSAAQDVNDLGPKSTAVWVTSDSDQIAATGDVMREVIRRNRLAGHEAQHPEIRNFRVKGPRLIMQELFTRSGHALYRMWEPACWSTFDYTPLPQLALETDGLSCLSATNIRASIPLKTQEMAVSLFFLDLLATSIADPSFLFIPPRGELIIAIGNQVRLAFTRDAQANLLTEKFGWTTFDALLLSSPIARERGTGTMFDPVLIHRLRELHGVEHLSPYAILLLLINQACDFVDTMLHPEAGNPNKERQYSPTGVMAEGQQMEHSQTASWQWMKITAMHRHNEQWMVVDIEFKRNEHEVIPEDEDTPENAAPAVGQYQPTVDDPALYDGGIAVWKNPRYSNDKPIVGLQDHSFLSIAFSAGDTDDVWREHTIEGWVVDHKSEARRKGQRAKLFDKTLIHSVQIIAKVTATQRALFTRYLATPPCIYIKDIKRTGSPLHIPLVRHTLETTDLVQLAANGALLNLTDCWEKNGLTTDPRVQLMIQAAKVPENAFEENVMLRLAVLDMLEALPRAAYQIAELAILISCRDTTRLGHDDDESVKTRTEELVGQISDVSVTLSASLLINGPEATLTLLAEIIDMQSTLMSELTINGAQKVLGSWIEKRWGPPGTGKSTLLNLLTILRACLPKVSPTVTLCTQNSAVRELANGFATMAGSDSTALGKVGRMLATSQVNKPEHTPIDMSPSLLKKAEHVMVTAGAARNDLTRPHPIVNWHALLNAVLEEAQMLVGVITYLIIGPIIMAIILANGGQIVFTGDPKQHKGGRETENSRMITRHSAFSCAGGRSTHNVPITPPYAIARIETMFLFMRLDKEMVNSLDRAKKLIMGVVQTVITLQAAIDEHWENWCCSDRCGNCDECVQANLDLKIIRRLAAQSTGFAQLGPTRPQFFAYLEERIAHITELYLNATKSAPNPDSLTELPHLRRWPSLDDMLPPPAGPIDVALRNYACMTNIDLFAETNTAAGSPYRYTALQGAGCEQRYISDTMYPAACARRMPPYIHRWVYVTDYTMSVAPGTSDPYAPHAQAGSITTRLYTGYALPKLDLTRLTKQELSRHLKIRQDLVDVPAITRFCHPNVIKQCKQMPTHQSRVDYNRDNTVHLSALLVVYNLAHFPECFDGHQKLTIITGTHVTHKALKEKLCLNSGAYAGDNMDKDATTCDRMEDSLTEIPAADVELILLDLLNTGYGVGAMKAVIEVILASEAVGTSFTVDIESTNNESGAQNTEPANTVTSSRGRGAHFPVRGINTPRSHGPRMRRIRANDSIGRTFLIPGKEILPKRLTLSPLMHLCMQDIANSKPKDLNPTARIIARSVHECTKYLLCRHEVTKTINNPDAISYVLGIDHPECSPHNPTSFPIPYGTIIIVMSKDVCDAHLDQPTGVYVQGATSSVGDVEGGFWHEEEGMPMVYTHNYQRLEYIRVAEGGLLAMDPRRTLALFPRSGTKKNQWSLRGSMRLAVAGKPRYTWVHIFLEGHIDEVRKKNSKNNIPTPVTIYGGQRTVRDADSHGLRPIGQAFFMEPGDDRTNWFRPFIYAQLGWYAERVLVSLRMYAGLDLATITLPFLTRNEIEL